MSRETDFETRMEADATIMALLTGGVHVYGSLGLQGVTRETVPAAFDANGFLKPLCVVKQRAAVPDGAVDDMIEKDASYGQAVELWFYEDRLFANIDPAVARAKVLFHGHRFSDSFPMEAPVNIITRGIEGDGALKGKSVARQDWQVIDIQ